MFYKTIIVVLVLSFSLTAFAAKIDADPQKILTPKESISFYARFYGASEVELLTVARCESNFNPRAFHKNDGGKGKHSVGIFQYSEQTFNRFSEIFGEDLDYYSYNDQARLTAYIFKNHPELKTHWTCWNMNY